VLRLRARPDRAARFGDSVADNLFSVELSNAVAVETDAQFVTVLSAGATSIGSSGVTAENVRSDLRSMLASVTTNARSALFLLVTSSIAKTLAVLHDNTGGAAFPTLTVNGGSLAGIQVVVSDGVPASTMLLVDAQQVAAASETIQLAATGEAVAQLDTSPDSPASGSSVMTSLWAGQFDRPESRAGLRRSEAYQHRRRASYWRRLHRRQPRPMSELTQEPSMMRAMIRREIQKFTDDVLAEAIGRAVGEVMRQNEARCSALEAQITGLRSAIRASDDDASADKISA
jgi:hypothetical protein